MISKELLSEVLGDERIKGENISVAGNLLHYDRLTHMTYINIYELAHKCKEWARKNGYSVQSGTKQDTKGYFVFSSKDFTCVSPSTCFNVDASDTEPEAIFKACEWILEQKEKQ